MPHIEERIEERIAEYVNGNLLAEGSAPLAHDASLAEAGVLDSIAVAALLAFAESEFGIVVEENEIDLENVETVNAIAALVRRKCVRRKRVPRKHVRRKHVRRMRAAGADAACEEDTP